jgi:predicted SAM-dependent methyltransferase
MRDYLIRKTDREGLLYQIVLQVLLVVRKGGNLHNRLTRGHRIKRYFDSHSTTKVHLGCGSDHLEGFLNTDLLGRIPVDITRKLPFPSNSVDLIYSNHLIEHILNRELRFHLKETHRVLKSGGVYIVATPSLSRLISILYTGDSPKEKQFLLDRYERKTNVRLDPATFLYRVMHVDYGHRLLYDFEAIRKLANEIGYSETRAIPNLEVPDPAISDNLRSRKGESWTIVTETYLLFK